jgi:hypothetical protein
VHGPFRIPGGSGDVEDRFCVGLGVERVLKARRDRGSTADFADFTNGRMKCIEFFEEEIVEAD